MELPVADRPTMVGPGHSAMALTDRANLVYLKGIFYIVWPSLQISRGEFMPSRMITPVRLDF